MNAKVNITNRAGASFPVRRLELSFAHINKYWMNNSAGMTHFMTALSSLFPAGEKFFIDSVRAVRDYPQLKNNELLQKEISAFIGQEAMHTKEHQHFNHAAHLYGVDVHTLEEKTQGVIDFFRKGFTRAFKPFGITDEMVGLIGTTALEHFTATIATQLLENKEFHSMIQDDTMYRLWMWHAIEENEHKAVVYDVFQSIFGKGIKAYAFRNMGMITAMFALSLAMAYFTARLLKEDNQLNVTAIKDIYTAFFKPSSGIIAGMVPELLMYFKPNFHPNDLDTVQLLKDWKIKLGFDVQAA